MSATAGPGAVADRVGAEDAPLLELRGVRKVFGAVQALDDVRFSVHAGEAVALVGDNGAGKSTLIKTISGAGPADGGAFRFEGREVAIRSPQDAADLGVAVVYQDLALCDNLDVVQNLFLGRERKRGKVGHVAALDEEAMEHETLKLLASLSVKSLRSVRTEVELLSGGQRQTVAIARSMIGDPKVVILDEPTAALGVAQTAQVLDLIRRLRDRGHGVVLISHNLSDVFEVCDRVTVLRLGRNAGDFPATADQRQAVVAAITGVGPESEREAV